MSERKALMRIGERVAILIVALLMTLFIPVASGILLGEHLSPMLIFSFFAVGFLGVLTTNLERECNDAQAAINASKGCWENFFSFDGLLVRWSPQCYKFGSYAGVAAFVFAFMAINSSSFSFTFGQRIANREAVGTMLALCGFCLTFLPVIASAARMPGTFEDTLT